MRSVQPVLSCLSHVLSSSGSKRLDQEQSSYRQGWNFLSSLSYSLAHQGPLTCQSVDSIVFSWHANYPWLVKHCHPSSTCCKPSCFQLSDSNGLSCLVKPSQLAYVWLGSGGKALRLWHSDWCPRNRALLWRFVGFLWRWWGFWKAWSVSCASAQMCLAYSSS